jgi:hypothetical protein
MIRLDIEYAKNKNLWLDIIIILKTPPALLVQMWDTRVKKRTPAPRPTPPSTVIAARALNQ